MTLKSYVIGTLVSTISLVSFVSAAQPETVVDIAVWSDVHTTLVSAVLAADLAGTLSSEWPFTVFAPVNDAFAKLPAGTVETLLMEENIDLLRSILTYHVVPGKVMANDLTQGLTATTVQWDDVMLTHTNNAWYINSAKIIATDLVAGNGVVHVIDSVIMPPMSKSEVLNTIYELRGDMDEMMEAKIDTALMKYDMIVADMDDAHVALTNSKLMIAIDMYIEEYEMNSDVVAMLSLLKYEIMADVAATDVVDVALGSDVHTTLVTAVVEAGLVDTLKSDGPFTVFAPINDAFAKLPAGTVESLLAQESKADLTNILTYHVVSGAYMASDITDGLMLETVNGDSLEFTITDGVVSINGMTTLLSTDILTSNGIVHVIDDVLIPGE